jgi:O-methyltransferase
MIHKIVSALHSTTGSTPPAGGERRLSPSGSSKRSEHPALNYDEEELARKAIALVESHTMLSYQRLVTLWQQVRYLDRAGVQGCLVECGTWKGGAAALMALAHRESGKPHRDLHLFDSFEGLPEPDRAHDGDMAVRYAGARASGMLRSIGKCVGTLEDNRQAVSAIAGYPSSLTHFHVGWFQDTLHTLPASFGEIALLRIDGDWYESTKICLDMLFPQVVSGGIVVIDDYGKWSGCRKAVDEFMATLHRPLLLNHIDAAGRYLIVP